VEVINLFHEIQQWFCLFSYYRYYWLKIKKKKRKKENKNKDFANRIEVIKLGQEKKKH
jgi:hypothetical protein